MFGKNQKTAEQFRELVIKVTWRVRKIVEQLFPQYKIVDDSSLTWRMTETKSEVMHYDSYGESVSDLHNVPVFMNLDTNAGSSTPV
jgi:hypothetical protein